MRLFKCLEAFLRFSGKQSKKKILEAAVKGYLPQACGEFHGRPSPPKIQGCQIDQQIQSWSKDRLQDGLVFLHETEHPKHE